MENNSSLVLYLLKNLFCTVSYVVIHVFHNILTKKSPLNFFKFQSINNFQFRCGFKNLKYYIKLFTKINIFFIFSSSAYPCSLLSASTVFSFSLSSLHVCLSLPECFSLMSLFISTGLIFLFTFYICISAAELQNK